MQFLECDLKFVNKIIPGLGRLGFLVVRADGDPASQQLVSDPNAGEISRKHRNQLDDLNCITQKPLVQITCHLQSLLPLAFCLLYLVPEYQNPARTSQ